MGTIDIDGAALTYDVDGQGESAIAFVHGWCSKAAHWDRQVEYFAPTHRIVFLFYIILALALLTNWVTIRLRRLPIGRAWEALREDEVACRALGINTTTTKLTAFATGAMFGGFAGAFSGGTET